MTIYDDTDDAPELTEYQEALLARTIRDSIISGKMIYVSVPPWTAEPEHNWRRWLDLVPREAAD